ncbi:MAG: 16S rRNA (guanine(527)-N(7))-methyltransferase RsmG [Clostridia bacterium]|nr:16S rRNA (guanine(527)-N(7))-methyltransferase RsmG [Clostridia bacterium]
MLEELKLVLDRYSIPFSEENAEKLVKFVELMKKYNESHNITAITEDFDVIYKHLLDSLLPINKIENNLKLIDVGCGAGFPSVPLAIVNEKLDMTALDSVNKKIEFVKIVKNTLNLHNLTPIHSRIEEFALNPKYRESFDIVLSRAVAPLNIILEYSAPLLKNGGYVFAYKGSNYMEELNNCKSALKILDCEVEEVFEYDIDEIGAKRYVLKIKKKSSLSNKYPRKQNKPRLQPL